MDRSIAPGRETHGPLDLRPIGPNDIAAARQHVAGLLRTVRAASGHRAAVTVALAAVASAMDVLAELGAAGAARDALRLSLAELEDCAAARPANQSAGSLH